MSEWIKCSDRLPILNYECGETGLMISDAVLISDSSDYPSFGFGHLNEQGAWIKYNGEHDFMNVTNVTHWQPLPEPPTN